MEFRRIKTSVFLFFVLLFFAEWMTQAAMLETMTLRPLAASFFMAKRFTDTDKYKKAFIRGLPGPYKLLWDFLCCDCNHAGVWHKDFEIAQIYLGKDMLVDEENAIKYFNANRERVRVFDNGKKWLIMPFIGFQYGKLNPQNRAHQAVLFSLSKAGIKPLLSPLQGAKDKDKEKEKEKEKEKVKEKEGGVGETFAFDEIWNLYPRREGKKEAEKHFRASVKTKEDWNAVHFALGKYRGYLDKHKVEPRFVKMGSTWFNNWRDWLTFEEPKSPIESQKEKQRLLDEERDRIISEFKGTDQVRA